MSTELPDGVSVEDARANADMFVRVGALVNLMRDYLYAPKGSVDERSALDALEEYADEMVASPIVASEAILYLGSCIVTAADQGDVDRWFADHLDRAATVIREAD